MRATTFDKFRNAIVSTNRTEQNRAYDLIQDLWNHIYTSAAEYYPIFVDNFNTFSKDDEFKAAVKNIVRQEGSHPAFNALKQFEAQVTIAYEELGLDVRIVESFFAGRDVTVAPPAAGGAGTGGGAAGGGGAAASASTITDVADSVAILTADDRSQLEAAINSSIENFRSAIVSTNPSEQSNANELLATLLDDLSNSEDEYLPQLKETFTKLSKDAAFSTAVKNIVSQKGSHPAFNAINQFSALVNAAYSALGDDVRVVTSFFTAPDVSVTAPAAGGAGTGGGAAAAADAALESSHERTPIHSLSRTSSTPSPRGILVPEGSRRFSGPNVIDESRNPMGRRANIESEAFDDNIIQSWKEDSFTQAIAASGRTKEDKASKGKPARHSKKVTFHDDVTVAGYSPDEITEDRTGFVPLSPFDHPPTVNVKPGTLEPKEKHIVEPLEQHERIRTKESHYTPTMRGDRLDDERQADYRYSEELEPSPAAEKLHNTITKTPERMEAAVDEFVASHFHEDGTPDNNQIIRDTTDTRFGGKTILEIMAALAKSGNKKAKEAFLYLIEIVANAFNALNRKADERLRPILGDAVSYNTVSGITSEPTTVRPTHLAATSAPNVGGAAAGGGGRPDASPGLKTTITHPRRAPATSLDPTVTTPAARVPAGRTSRVVTTTVRPAESFDDSHKESIINRRFGVAGDAVAQGPGGIGRAINPEAFDADSSIVTAYTMHTAAGNGMEQGGSDDSFYRVVPAFEMVTSVDHSKKHTQSILTADMDLRTLIEAGDVERLRTYVRSVGTANILFYLREAQYDSLHPEQLGSSYQSMLNYAIEHNNRDLAIMLIEEGASLVHNMPVSGNHHPHVERNKYPAIVLAAREDRLELIAELHGKGMLDGLDNNTKLMMIYYAMNYANMDTIKYLIEAMDLARFTDTTIDTGDMSPLYFIGTMNAGQNPLEKAEMLLSNPEKFTDGQILYALHACARYGHYDRAAVIVSKCEDRLKNIIIQAWPITESNEKIHKQINGLIKTLLDSHKRSSIVISDDLPDMTAFNFILGTIDEIISPKKGDDSKTAQSKLMMRESFYNFLDGISTDHFGKEGTPQANHKLMYLRTIRKDKDKPFENAAFDKDNRLYRKAFAFGCRIPHSIPPGEHGYCLALIAREFVEMGLKHPDTPNAGYSQSGYAYIRNIFDLSGRLEELARGLPKERIEYFNSIGKFTEKDTKLDAETLRASMDRRLAGGGRGGGGAAAPEEEATADKSAKTHTLTRFERAVEIANRMRNAESTARSEETLDPRAAGGGGRGGATSTASKAEPDLINSLFEQIKLGSHENIAILRELAQTDPSAFKDEHFLNARRAGISPDIISQIQAIQSKSMRPSASTAFAARVEEEKADKGSGCVIS